MTEIDKWAKKWIFTSQKINKTFWNKILKYFSTIKVKTNTENSSLNQQFPFLLAINSHQFLPFAKRAVVSIQIKRMYIFFFSHFRFLLAQCQRKHSHNYIRVTWWRLFHILRKRHKKSFFLSSAFYFMLNKWSF